MFIFKLSKYTIFWTTLYASEQGILTEGERLSKVDLLIKVAGFGKKTKQYFLFAKEMIYIS